MPEQGGGGGARNLAELSRKPRYVGCESADVESISETTEDIGQQTARRARMITTAHYLVVAPSDAFKQVGSQVLRRNDLLPISQQSLLGVQKQSQRLVGEKEHLRTQAQTLSQRQGRDKSQTDRYIKTLDLDVRNETLGRDRILVAEIIRLMRELVAGKQVRITSNNSAGHWADGEEAMFVGSSGILTDPPQQNSPHKKEWGSAIDPPRYRQRHLKWAFLPREIDDFGQLDRTRA